MTKNKKRGKKYSQKKYTGDYAKQKETKVKANPEKEPSKKTSRNKLIMKILIFLGVIVLGVTLIYLMNYFFVEHNDIKINMSTDKKLEYITVAGEQELISTQKYVSDLDYSMRYDINNFVVFKYKDQDYFKFADSEKIVVIVSKSTVPSSCNSQTTLENNYNNCYLKVDDYTEEYYISEQGVTYKITVKSLNTKEYVQNIEPRISYMLNTFEMNIA